MLESRSHSRLSLFVNAALVGLAFGLLGWVIWQNGERIREVFSRRLDLSLFALALAISWIALIGTFLRWFLLVRVIEPSFPFGATLLLGLIGLVFNSVIPGAVGGDLIKAAFLARMRIKRTQAIASMVIDRIIGLLGLFILGALAGAFAWRLAPAGIRALIVAEWLALSSGTLILAAVFAPALILVLPRGKSGHSFLGVIATELREMSTTYRRRLDVVTACVGISVLTQASNVLVFYLVGRMLFPSMTTTLAQHFLLVPLTLFSTALPLPFGALGVSEEVGDQLFHLVGHPSGALAMMGYRVVLYAGTAIGAFVYLARINEVRALTIAAQHPEAEQLGGQLVEHGAEGRGGSP
jgi:hypothetical protein